MSSISDRLAVTAAARDAVSARYAELVRGELDALPFDRAVLAALTGEAGFTEVGRMSREPRDGERSLRRGHLLMRRR